MHAQTTTTSSATGNRVLSRALFKIEKFFIRPIALSTCILAFAIYFVSCTFFPVICSCPVLNGGIFREAAFIMMSSVMVNPRSARIKSPGSSKSRKPDALVMCW